MERPIEMFGFNELAFVLLGADIRLVGGGGGIAPLVSGSAVIGTLKKCTYIDCLLIKSILVPSLSVNITYHYYYKYNW